METVTDFIFLGSKITVDGDGSHGIKKTLTRWKGSYDQPRQSIKKQRYYFAKKCPIQYCKVKYSKNKNFLKSPYNQSYGFSSHHVWMSELDHKEGWAPKNF